MVWWCSVILFINICIEICFVSIHFVVKSNLFVIILIEMANGRRLKFIIVWNSQTHNNHNNFFPTIDCYSICSQCVINSISDLKMVTLSPLGVYWKDDSAIHGWQFADWAKQYREQENEERHTILAVPISGACRVYYIYDFIYVNWKVIKNLIDWMESHSVTKM